MNSSQETSQSKWQHVCADLVAESGLLIRDARQEDWDNPGLLQDYFASASLGVGRDLEVASIQALLKKSPQPSDLVGLFAEAPDGSCGGLLLQDKAWDSDMLSVQVRNLTVLANAPTRQARHAIAFNLIRFCLGLRREILGDCIFVRSPSDDTALLWALAENGFRPLVPMVTLGRELNGDSSAVPPAGLRVGEVRKEEIDEVQRMAGTAFRWGRFVAEMRFPREGVERLHGTWARNCCLGTQAERVLVARDEHKVLGFIAVKFQEVREARVGSIELIAIAESSRGRGLGAALVSEGCKWLSSSTAYVVVRTELPNSAALRMYEAQGFRILNGSIYLSH